jgi:hypothetical protein
VCEGERERERERGALAHATAASHSWDASSKVSSCNDFAGTANPLINCSQFKCALDCEDSCGWDRAANACLVGEDTSDRERELRLGDCAATVSDTDAGGVSADTAIAVATSVAVLVIAVTVKYVCSKRASTDVQQRAEAAEYANNPAYNNDPCYEAIQPRAIADSNTGAAYADVEDAVGHTNEAGYAVAETSYSHA